MEQQNKNRKISYIFIVITILLIIAVGLGGWFLGTRFATREDDFSESSNSNTNTVIEKIEKEDESKDYVYDATYTYENTFENYKEYTSTVDAIKKLDYGIEVEYTEGTQYLENLRVPYINIKSEAASKINEQIEVLYLDYAKSFEDNAIAIRDEETLPIVSHILTYRAYTTDDILSIVIIYDKRAAAPWSLNYLTYNFDLKSGNLLSYEGVLSRLGYNAEDILKVLENLIDDKINSLRAEYQIQENEEESEKFLVESKERLEESISSKQVLFFVNNERLNIITTIEYGNEYFDSYIFEVEK